MLKKIIKKVFSKLGLEIKRKNKVKGNTEIHYSAEDVYRLLWLIDYKINTIIDVGANEGQFARKIISIFPKAKVYCFEPLPEVFEKLRHNFMDNRNVALFNFGLGQINNEMPIYSNEFSPSSSLLEMLDLHKTNFDFAISTEKVQIKIKRLDDIFEIPPHGPLLVKIDVQGYEENVLKGGENIIKLADVIIIETSFIPLYMDQPLFGDIYNHLINRGFLYAGNIDQLISPKNHQILHADAIFLKNKVMS